MSAPILATKLYIPPPRPNAVPRPQLISRLDAGLQRKLTLLSAPVGYGKSTLLSEWVAGSQRPALVGEASLWLLVRGVNVSSWRARAGAPGPTFLLYLFP